MQSNAGWSHEISSDTVFSFDYVNSLGRDLNFRPRLNQRIPGNLSNPRRLAAIVPTLNPNTNANRPTVSRGESTYNAGDLLGAPPPHARLRPAGELHAAERHQQHRQRGRRAQHREHPGSEQPVPGSAPVRAERDHRLAPRDQPQRVRSSCRGASGSRRSTCIRSALPVNLIDGRDLNLDGDAVDIPAKAYAVDSFDANAATRLADHLQGDRQLRNGQLRPRHGRSSR